ncbi:MAG TPA: hypothetical protein VGJ05_16155 [Fimbriiglobus sp.]|jgi:hypothetical protein
MFVPNGVVIAQDPETPPRAKHDPKDVIKSDALWITVGILALVLVVGAFILAAVDRWRKRSAAFDREAIEEVSTIREMYEGGEITHSEYERIRTNLATRVKAKVGLNAPPPTPTIPPGPEKAGPSGSGEGSLPGNLG